MFPSTSVAPPRFQSNLPDRGLIRRRGERLQARRRRQRHAARTSTSLSSLRDRRWRGHDVHRSIDQCSALRFRPDLFRSVAEPMMWSRLRDQAYSGGVPELPSGTTQRARGRVNHVAVPAPHDRVRVHEPIRFCSSSTAVHTYRRGTTNARARAVRHFRSSANERLEASSSSASTRVRVLSGLEFEIQRGSSSQARLKESRSDLRNRAARLSRPQSPRRRRSGGRRRRRGW